MINEFEFRVFASFFDAVYSQIKIRKIDDNMFSVFTAAAYLGPYLGS